MGPWARGARGRATAPDPTPLQNALPLSLRSGREFDFSVPTGAGGVFFTFTSFEGSRDRQDLQFQREKERTFRTYINLGEGLPQVALTQQ